jgi:RimJ/RimL family protein N-acetyltransferase
MSFSYKVLKQQIFSNGQQSIVPIRMEDRESIRIWRNQQIFHLRQSNPLSKDDQDHYFYTVVKGLFAQEQPNQILFSYLEDNECIGYGGLVHINWIDQNAEISFLMKTDITGDMFRMHFVRFMSLIEQVAFQELNLHKLYTYAFDLRPYIYKALEESGFKQEAVLKEHSFHEGVFIDVIIHAKFNT